MAISVVDNCCSCGETGECRSRAKGGEHPFSGFYPFSPLQIAASPYAEGAWPLGPSLPPTAAFRANYAFGWNYGGSAMPVFVPGPIECYRTAPVHFGDSARVRKRYLKVVISGTGHMTKAESDPGFEPLHPDKPFAYTYENEFHIEPHTNAIKFASFTFNGSLIWSEEVDDAGVYTLTGTIGYVPGDAITPSIGPYINLTPEGSSVDGWNSSTAVVTENSAVYTEKFDYLHAGSPEELTNTSTITLSEEYSVADCLADALALWAALTYGGTHDTYSSPATYTLDWGTATHMVWVRDYGAYIYDAGDPDVRPEAPLVMAAARGSSPLFRGALCSIGAVYRVGLTEGYAWGSQMEMSATPGTHSCFIAQEWISPVPDEDPDPGVDDGHDGFFDSDHDCTEDLGVGAGTFELEPTDVPFAQGAGCFQFQCAVSELAPCFPYETECA